MTSNDNLVDVGKDRLVGIVLNQLIKDVVRRDIGVLDRVLVSTTASPLRTLPDQSVGPRLRATASLLLSTRRIIPVWV